MDRKVEIKEEPVCLEATAITSFENFELLSEMIPLKEETKPELIVPETIQESTFEPVADIKDEIIMEEHTIDELVPCIKEENSAKNIAELPKGEKFSCDFCCKEFIRRKHLKGHLLVHSGEKAHRCTKCNSTFHKKNDLKRHIFTHSGVKPYSCSLCSSTFSRKDLLTKHMLVHSGDKPYSCEVCDSKYAQRKSLKAHMFTHANETPYQCKICSKYFTCNNSLNVHMSRYSEKRTI